MHVYRNLINIVDESIIKHILNLIFISMPKTSKDILNKKYEEALSKVKVGAKYKHFRDPVTEYTLKEVVMLEETEEAAVIYQPPNWKIAWVRTVDNFLEEVEHEGEKKSRFTLVE
jgi:hypothetical protein